MLSNSTNKVLIRTLLKSDKDTLATLLEVFGNEGWPDLNTIKVGVNQSLGNLTSYSIVNRCYKVDSHKLEMDELWSSFMSQSGFSMDICPTVLLNHILYNGYKKTAQTILKNTAPPELKSWLSNKDMDSMFHDSGRDKCSNFGVLVQSGSVDIMQCLADLDPTYLHTLDHKNRSALFYARNIDMVAFLASQNVDVSLKDKDGFDALQTWTEVLRNPSASEWMGALNTVDPLSRVVQKMLSMQLNTLDEEERLLFEKGVQNNVGWKGNILGSEKEWSFSEIWNFAVVLHAINLLKSPTSTQSHYYYNNDNRITKNANGFKEIIEKQMSHMPVDLQNELKQKTNKSLAVQWLISFCKNWDGCPENLIKVDHAYEQIQKSHYTRPEQIQPYLTPLNNILLLSNSTENDRREFASHLASYASLTKLWAHPSILGRFVSSIDMFVLPPEKGGVLSAELVSSIAFLRLNEGLRSKDVLASWMKAFNTLVIPKWNEDVKSGEDLQKWAPVLQLGLSYSPLSNDDSFLRIVGPFNATLQDMLMKNVEIEKIPLRFAKNMPHDLRSAASRWILNKALSSKIKIEEEVQAPRRRM